MDFQSNCWAYLRNLGQPAEFQVPGSVALSLCTTAHPHYTIFSLTFRYLYFWSGDATEPCTHRLVRQVEVEWLGALRRGVVRDDPRRLGSGRTAASDKAVPIVIVSLV